MVFFFFSLFFFSLLFLFPIFSIFSGRHINGWDGIQG